MKYKVTLNNKTYEVEVELGQAMITDEYDALAPTPAPVAIPVAIPQQQAPAPASPASATQTNANAVLAPISGTVLKVDGKVGTAVKEGDVIMIIEAMKMENEILAPKAGTITEIYVAKGATVETGDALFNIS